MSLPSPDDKDGTHARRPLQYQRNIGCDMSMTFLAYPTSPWEFAHPDQHQIKGFNIEAVARVAFPQPSWITAPEYRSLQVDSGDGYRDSAFFSLNVSLYERKFIASEWENMWFLFYGRVHPYTLTWPVEPVEPDDSLETIESPQDYNTPVLMVRDQSYQFIAPQSFTASQNLPTMPPIVSFTGPVIGSGQTLLHGDLTSTLGDTQLKCCGFVQLSSFILPANPDKPPFGGFHPFQVFIIFPIHANPWTSLCKKMMDRHATQFQAYTLFSCTGKVAGFLNHRHIANPPELAQDYVFIVVPDTWTFYDKAALDSVSALPSANAPAEGPRSDPPGSSKRSDRWAHRVPSTPSKKQRTSTYQ